MQPLSGNQCPDLLTALMNMSLVLRLPRKKHLCRSSSNAPRLPSFLEMLQNPHVLLTFDKVHNPLRLPRETASEPPKVVRTTGVFNILTSKCALRHKAVHFFDISTSKSGPHLVCFVDFTSKCASRHNGVHFFISHLASWLRTRRFSEPTFRPSGGTNHWKNTVFRDFPTFSRICIFFLLTLSLLLFSLLIFLFSLPLPCSAFHLSILSEVWPLNFFDESVINEIWCSSVLWLSMVFRFVSHVPLARRNPMTRMRTTWERPQARRERLLQPTMLEACSTWHPQPSPRNLSSSPRAGARAGKAMARLPTKMNFLMQRQVLSVSLMEEVQVRMAPWHPRLGWTKSWRVWPMMKTYGMSPKLTASSTKKLASSAFSSWKWRRSFPRQSLDKSPKGRGVTKMWSPSMGYINADVVLLLSY